MQREHLERCCPYRIHPTNATRYALLLLLWWFLLKFFIFCLNSKETILSLLTCFPYLIKNIFLRQNTFFFTGLLIPVTLLFNFFLPKIKKNDLKGLFQIISENNSNLYCALNKSTKINPDYSAGLEETQAGIKIARRNINHLRYADDTTLMAESEEELKSLLMKVI